MKFIKDIFSDVGNQLTKKMNFWRYEPDKREIHFSKAFQDSAKIHNVSEKDALDVYYHGYMVKPNMMERNYNGYSIGIYYFIANDTGRIVIHKTWKLSRR